MSYSIKEALDIAKTFTYARRKPIQDSPRPALRGAYIDKENVWATDSHWMVRIKHKEGIELPKIHGYSMGDALYFSNDSNYPDCTAILPDINQYRCKLKIENLFEWINSHEQICLMKHNRFHTTLDTAERTLKAKSLEKNIFGEYIAFVYRDLPFEELGEPIKIYYDASKLLEILKIIQKLNVTEINMYFFNSIKPMVIEAEDILFLVLPWQDDYFPVPEKTKKSPKEKKEPKPKPEPKQKAKKKTKVTITAKPKAKKKKKR